MNRIITCLLFLLVGQAHALEVVQSHEIEKIFIAAHATGTFALYDVNTDKLIVHNLARAEKRFIPASTFKIANSLIGLSTGAVKSVDEVLPYGGKPQYFKAWELDMNLRHAIKVSNLPVYQELARRIGIGRMREGLKAIPYGNAETGNEVDTFWLKGPL
jgi:beta-lactamase class D OXA-50